MGLQFISGKAKAAGKVSTYATFVVGVLTWVADQYHLLGSLPSVYQGFVVAAVSAGVVGGSTFVAGYVSRHEPGLVTELKAGWSEVSQHGLDPSSDTPPASE
jgi:hypothetical protein